MTTDERLAALEAKMDALTAPPSDYYTSRYSGEEIDALLSSVGPGTVVPVERGGTNATTAKDAAQNLYVPTLLGGTDIPVNADLNSYTAVGNYCCPVTANVKTLVNCPTESAFIMKVFYATGTSGYIGQEILNITGVRFSRYYEKYSATWATWKSSYSTSNKPTAADVGAPTLAQYNALLARVEALEAQL